MPMPNPYEGVGRPADGDRFVGRKELLEQLEKAWSSPHAALANLRVEGNHRIGKTSIVLRAIELEKRKPRPDLVFVFLSLGYSSGPTAFRKVVEKVLDAARVAPSISANSVSRLGRMAARVLTVSASDGLYSDIADFFEILRDTPLRVVVVLDELDRADVVFVRSDFQFLRTLVNGNWPVALVTVSRRSVATIVDKDEIGSNLATTLRLCSVRLFEPGETDALIERSAESGVDLLPHRDQILDYAGNHPYLLEMLCHEAVRQHETLGTVDITRAYESVYQPFDELFHRVVKRLDEDSSGRARQILRAVAVGSPLLGRDLDLVRRMSIVPRSDSATFFSAEFGRYVTGLLRKEEDRYNSGQVVEAVVQLCRRMPEMARPLQQRRKNKTPFVLADEHDVQDLLYAALMGQFGRVDREVHVPSLGEAGGRCDFVLAEAGLFLEVKMATETHNARAIRDELAADKETYSKHPGCRQLVFFVYDPHGIIQNRHGFEKDLSDLEAARPVRVVVAPNADPYA